MNRAQRRQSRRMSSVADLQGRTVEQKQLTFGELISQLANQALVHTQEARSCANRMVLAPNAEVQVSLMGEMNSHLLHAVESEVQLVASLVKGAAQLFSSPCSLTVHGKRED